MVHSPSSPDSPDSEMAAVAVQLPVSMDTSHSGGHSASNGGGANKRYRPAPAKTFQCRGYGECRMVFSRSEHLARHIRKHTGERPFSCHCSKQFSRLDNLRQHAQTVHADKQDENERMMRDLTSLHATMSAATKLGSGNRGGRRGATSGGANMASSVATSGAPLSLIKQEDLPPMHQRPGTSTGYEGDMLYYDNHNGSRSASHSSFRDQSQSFREPGQSFLVPPATSSSSNASGAAAAAAPGQSFLGYQRIQHSVTESSRFDSAFRPGSSSSRPATSSGATDAQHPRSLPPLAAVVAASLSTSPQQSFRPPSSAGPNSSISQQSQQHLQHPSQSVFPFHSSIYRRPSTANRPGTAPASASLFSAKPSVPDRSRMGSSSGRPDLSLLHSGFGRSSSGLSDQHYQLGDSGEVSNSPGNESSPFFFNAPPASTTTSPPSINPRKRTFGGPDGPCDDTTPLRSDRPTSSAGPIDYDYGTESRPQSRRLSVMELCNDDDEQQRPSSQRRDISQYASGSAAFLLSTATTRSYGPSSRPTTSSGLISSTSTLRLFDRSSPGSSPSSGTIQPPPIFSRTSTSATGPARDGVTSGTSSGATSSFGRAGSGLHATPSAPAFTSRIPSTGSSVQISSPGASSPASSPSTPTYPPASVLSASTSSSSSYPNRGAVQYQQSQQLEQQHGQSYQSTQQQQHSSQYQLAHSPALSSSSVSNASYSPRSPVSDGSRGSPFPAYAHPRSPGLYVDAGRSSPATPHASAGVSPGPHHRQRDGQVRTPVSPHTAGFGMRA